MAKQKKRVIEFRSYSLPPSFPVLLLTGDDWHISDVPAKCLHFHNCLEIGLCESDSGTLEFLNTSYPFHEGDVTVIPSNIAHTTYSSPGTASKWSYLFIDMEKFIYPVFSLEFVSKSSLIQNVVQSQSGIFSREKHPEVYDLVVYIIRVLEKKVPNYEYICGNLFSVLLITILNIYNTSENSDSINKEKPDNSFSIAPALEYIQKNYMLDFPITSLADMCNMSYTHFRRTFASVMGTGTLEYLIRIRIEKASLLLRTTDMPILHISETVGFTSLSSFNRHFNSIVGESPRDWRKRMSISNNLSVFKNTGWMTPPKD
ncbi:MAG: AraC family transcriptional regulator [bacterium]|nr:AraC family transcriptional regulator [bacterium]